MTPEVSTGSKKRSARKFVGLLELLVERTSGDKVRLGQLMDIVGLRSFGPVILLLGFVSITPLTIIPGANWLIAAVTLIFSSQMLFVRRRPWLPRKLLDTEFPRKYLEQAVKSGMKAAQIADKVTAPRLAFLTEWPFSLIPASLAIMAALVTFPLGFVPFGPVLPGIALILLGVGLTARDGLFLILALLALAGSTVLVVRFLQQVGILS